MPRLRRLPSRFVRPAGRTKREGSRRNLGMRIGVGVVAAVLLALTGAPHASAATFAVTRTDDPAPDACAPSDCSLREAVLTASPGDVVQVPAGHYRLSIPGAGEDVG